MVTFMFFQIKIYRFIFFIYPNPNTSVVRAYSMYFYRHYWCHKLWSTFQTIPIKKLCQDLQTDKHCMYFSYLLVHELKHNDGLSLSLSLCKKRCVMHLPLQKMVNDLLSSKFIPVLIRTVTETVSCGLLFHNLR